MLAVLHVIKPERIRAVKVRTDHREIQHLNDEFPKDY